MSETRATGNNVRLSSSLTSAEGSQSEISHAGVSFLSVSGHNFYGNMRACVAHDIKVGTKLLEFHFGQSSKKHSYMQSIKLPYYLSFTLVK